MNIKENNNIVSIFDKLDQNQYVHAQKSSDKKFF